MNAERFQKVMSLFQEACDLPADRRAAFLDRACNGDAELRREVETLLTHDENATMRIGEAKFTDAAAKLAAEIASGGGLAAETDEPPETIGRYRVIRRIGEGGMGTVYEAEQESPRRTVAIKVLRPGPGWSGLRKRFEHEAHILGRLQHPGIAQIIEAGSEIVNSGTRMYLVMEYIHGRNLMDYANTHRLEPRQRLNLFIRICEAVQHAHQKGVTHRDLKPANILIVEDANQVRTNASDSRVLEPAQPKVLDFGVARLNDSDCNVTMAQTVAGQLIGTLPYMSPEQVGGDPAEIDTRSDIYALGVILHELLTGRLPYDLRNRSIPEAARIICDEPPTRLSTISRHYRGDLETIVAKALEKDRTRRYQSAADLAADVQAHLDGAPIAAKRDSGWYVLQKTLYRYKVASAIGLVFVLLLGGAAVALGVLYQRAAHQAEVARAERDRATEAEQAARRERDRATEAESDARRQALKARRVSDFLRSVLHAADSRARGREAKIVDALEFARERIENELRSELDAMADALYSLSLTYSDLGMLAEADATINAAIKTYRTITPEGSASLADAYNQLGVIASARGRHEEAIEALADAEAMHRQFSSDPDDKVAWDLSNMGAIYGRMRRFDKAEPLVREAIRLRREQIRDSQESYMNVAQSLNVLASILYQKREYDEAARVCQEAIDLYREKARVDVNSDLAAALNNLGAIELERGNKPTARRLYEESLVMIRAIRGNDHPEVSNALVNFAQFLRINGDPAAAEPLYRESLEIRRKIFGPGHLMLGHPLTGLGATLTALKRSREAEPLLREAYDIRMKLAPREFTTALTQAELGECLLDLGKWDEAEPLLLDSLESIRRDRGEQYVSTITGLKRLIRLYEATGKAEEVTRYRMQLEQAQVPIVPEP